MAAIKQYSAVTRGDNHIMLCGAEELATLFRDRMFFFDTVLHLSVNTAADQREGGKSGALRSSHLSSVIRSCRPTCECKGIEVTPGKDI